MILDFGIFIVDLTTWVNFINQTPVKIITDLFFMFGWALIGSLLFYLAAHFWEDYRGGKYTANWEFILLAIDVPAIAVQTPKAVEQIFAHLSGAYEPANLWERWWQGKAQRWFSFEIVSIEGYIQFLVWTEKQARDLVEAAIYAQYPEAEITEVEDYVSTLPEKYPDKEFDIHGVEFGLAANEAYPIRTYPDFKYDVNPDITFSDSMAALLENFTRVGKGENLWMQIIIVPTGNSWKEGGISLVKEVVAGGKAHHASALDSILGFPKRFTEEFLVYGWVNGAELSEPEEAAAGKVSDLTPGGRKTLEAIEAKISKIGFKSKIRLLYTARLENYMPRRCVGGVIGAMNQFHVPSSNAFISHGSTMSKGIDKNMHKNEFFKAYKKRKAKIGGNPYILNTEELATVWHFPMPFVKTPLIQKTYAKRAEAPSDLPVESSFGPLKPKNKEIDSTKGAPPDNLPGMDMSENFQLPISTPLTDLNKPIITDASGEIKPDNPLDKNKIA